MSFSRDLLSGNRLPEDVIDYQWPLIDYMDGNRLPAVTNCFDSNFKACNRLHKSCNRLPEEIFQKIISKGHICSKGF